MKALTLKQIRYLCSLAEHRHFGRAAEANFVTQPALSTQIKELEQMVDVPLVERHRKTIQITPLGEQIVEKGKEILSAVDEMGDIIRASQGQFTGRFRLGIIPTIAPYLLPDIVSKMGKEFPNLEVIPREAVTQVMLDELQNCRLDAAIVALPISLPAIREFSLFEEDFILVRSSSETGQPIPSPTMLKEMRLLLLGEGHCFRDQAISFCEINRTDNREIMEGSSLSTLVQMVGAGMGVTLIPEMAVPFETRSADVSVLRFRSKPPSRNIGLIWRKSNPLSKQFLDVGALIRKVSEKRKEQVLKMIDDPDS